MVLFGKEMSCPKKKIALKNAQNVQKKTIYKSPDGLIMKRVEFNV